MRIFSFGGGVQSVSVLVAQAKGLLKNPYDVFVFANVGEDSENPDTLEYLQNHVLPFAKKHGIKVAQVQKKGKTLYQHQMSQKRGVHIPVRLQSGAFGNRTCTETYKIREIDRYGKDNNQTHLEIGVGISVDEFTRVRPDRMQWHAGAFKSIQRKIEYPLIEMRYTRVMCAKLIVEANLPLPPKSSCFFCPFQKPSQWQDLHRRKPELFQKAVELEARCNEIRHDIGKDAVYLHTHMKPLSSAVGDQAVLTGFEAIMDNEACESGYCMT